MKRFTLILLLAASFGISSMAQNKSDRSTINPSSSNPLFVYKQTGKPDILCNWQTTGFSLAAINQYSIKSMEVLKDQTATSMYGDIGKNGVIIITLSSKTVLNKANELLKKYKISRADRKLPVYMDSKPLIGANSMYYDLSAIKAINITTEQEGANKYINIITTNARPETPTVGGVSIRGIPGKFN